MRTCYFLIVLATVQALGCVGSSDTPIASNAAKQDKQELTTERAKAAIVQMVADGNAPFGTPADADAINNLPVEKAEDGRYHLGAFTLAPNESKFSLSVIPRGPGKACAFFYDGQFVWRNSRWEAKITGESSALAEWPSREP
jgi:hypothetical protein